MAIVAADILIKLSKNTAPGNSTAQPNPNDSIGGFMSSTQMVDAALSNLFDIITGDENAAGVLDYRCFFVHNNHATLTWFAPKVWLSAEVAGGAVSAIGLDPVGVVVFNSAVAQAARPATEIIAPAGVAFTAPVTKATGLQIADMAPGTVQAIWVRRTALNTVPVDLDGVTFAIEGDTAA